MAAGLEENVKIKALAGIGGALAVALAAVAPATAHHSFSIFDAETTQVYTGVVVRVNPDANHLQIFFAPMNDERKNVLRDDAGQPLVYAVEMAGSAASAAEGVSVNTFAPGTVFSVGLHPLRNGDPAGHREGAIIKCPERTPPAAGLHCDTVEGHTMIGQGGLATPTTHAEETVASAGEGADGTE
jgi:hypothetical protein